MDGLVAPFVLSCDGRALLHQPLHDREVAVSTGSMDGLGARFGLSCDGRALLHCQLGILEVTAPAGAEQRIFS